jgi:proline iminopeptidase
MAASRRPYRDVTGFVPVEGARLYYRSLGERSDPTVLVVHGGPSDHRYLLSLADLVPRGYRVVWYDQLGCGRSTHPRSFREYSMEAAGRHVEAVRRGLRLGRPHLFGHSWGGALALEAAVLFPQSFRSLSVVGGFASDASFRRAMRRHVRSLPDALRIPIEQGERDGRYDSAAYRTAVRTRQQRYSFGVSVLPYEFALSLPSVNRQLRRAVYGRRPGLLSPPTGFLNGWDVSADLGRLRLPVLVASGGIEAGRFTARDLHRWIPHSRLVTFRGAAHLPFVQVRDEFLRTLLGFFESVGGRPRSPSRPGRRREGPRPGARNARNERTERVR